MDKHQAKEGQMVIYDSIQGETSRPPSKKGSKGSISIANNDVSMAMGEDLEHLR